MHTGERASITFFLLSEMDLPLLACTLSKFLITVVFCHWSQTFAQEICGDIGDNSEIELSAYKQDGFYLDMGNPACCTGNITSWRLCYYYKVNNRMDNKLYTVKYAVYRWRNRSSTQNYIQVSNRTFSTTLRGRNLMANSQQSGMVSFNCYNERLNTSFAVDQGDIIVACVVNPRGDMRRLDVVSDINIDTEGQQLYESVNPSNGNNYIKLCKDRMNLPATIIIDSNQQFSSVSRRLHLSANISKYTY